MQKLQEAGYALAALSASAVVFRLLVNKGLVTREEAVRAILDEAVQRAIFAESKLQEESSAKAPPKRTASGPKS